MDGFDRLLSDVSPAETDWIPAARRFRATGQAPDVSLAFVTVLLHCREFAERRHDYDLLKRAVDAVAAIALLVTLAPVLAVIALLSKLDSPGPVLFRQYRAGRFGVPFRILKFRTMPVNAEAERNRWAAPCQKPSPDELTRWGAFLRRYKLDELPQLWNVLVGHMSLVGPRPVPLADSACVPVTRLARFAVRPGMTGLWQTSVPHDAPARVKFFLDARYAKTAGFARPARRDLVLLWRTLVIVARALATFGRAGSGEAMCTALP